MVLRGNGLSVLAGARAALVDDGFFRGADPDLLAQALWMGEPACDQDRIPPVVSSLLTCIAASLLSTLENTCDQGGIGTCPIRCLIRAVLIERKRTTRPTVARPGRSRHWLSRSHYQRGRLVLGESRYR